MSIPTYALAPAPQQTLARWNDAVGNRSPGLLRPLLADNVVFHSPFVRTPIPGRDATLLVLTTVAQILKDFRYQRTLVGGPYDVGLEFCATFGNSELKGVELIRFNEAGEAVEVEVMIRPAKALQALGEAIGSRIGPQLLAIKAATPGAPDLQP